MRVRGIEGRPRGRIFFFLLPVLVVLVRDVPCQLDGFVSSGGNLLGSFSVSTLSKRKPVTIHYGFSWISWLVVKLFFSGREISGHRANFPRKYRQFDSFRPIQTPPSYFLVTLRVGLGRMQAGNYNNELGKGCFFNKWGERAPVISHFAILSTICSTVIPQLLTFFNIFCLISTLILSCSIVSSLYSVYLYKMLSYSKLKYYKSIRSPHTIHTRDWWVCDIQHDGYNSIPHSISHYRL